MRTQACRMDTLVFAKESPSVPVSVFVYFSRCGDAPSSSVFEKEKQIREALLELGVTLTCFEHQADLIVSVGEEDTVIEIVSSSRSIVAALTHVQSCVERMRQMFANTRFGDSKLRSAESTGARTLTHCGDVAESIIGKGVVDGQGQHYQRRETKSPWVQIEHVRTEESDGNNCTSATGDVDVLSVRLLTDIPYLAELTPGERAVSGAFDEVQNMSGVPYASLSRGLAAGEELMPVVVKKENLESAESTRGFADFLMPPRPLDEETTVNNSAWLANKSFPYWQSGEVDAAHSLAVVGRDAGSYSVISSGPLVDAEKAVESVASGNARKDVVPTSMGKWRRGPETNAGSSESGQGEKSLETKISKRQRNGDMQGISRLLGVRSPTGPNATPPADREVVYVDDEPDVTPPASVAIDSLPKRQKAEAKCYIPSSQRPPKYPHHIFLACHDEEAEVFLTDVVYHVGASTVRNMFGRVKKPTHFVMEEGGELTPALLLARALGIPVLTTLWLRDTITQGALPGELDKYTHKSFGKRNATAVGDSNTLDGGAMSTPLSVLSPTSDVARCFRSDTGPNYKPFLSGVSVFFVSNPQLATLTEYFVEIVRILGGTVIRRATCPRLSVIVHLSYGAVDLAVEEEEECRENHQHTARLSVTDPRWSPALGGRCADALETTALFFTYPNISLGTLGGKWSGGHCLEPRSMLQRQLQTVLKKRRELELEEVPVVSVEWLVQCVLNERLEETSAYTVPTLSEHATVALKRHVARGLLDSSERLGRRAIRQE